MNKQYIDINNVTINKTLSINKRKEAFIKQIQNPYCYLCDGIMVYIEYCENGESLENILVNYLASKR